MILTHGANSLDRLAEIGGRKYRTVKIGSQLWLAENLDFKFSGCNIGGSGTPSTPNAWYYDNDEATYGIDGVRKCGLLYNWYAVKLLNDNRTTLIPGWHVPTKEEFIALFGAVGGESTAGKKLKASNVSWAAYWNGTDDYGFGVLPAGYYTGSFINISANSALWTSSEYSSSDSYFVRFDASSSSIVQDHYYKIRGYSVRLVKDAT